LFVDYANLVESKFDEDLLEKKLVAFSDSTSNQICVVTVKNLNGETIDDVTYNTFNDWKIGDAKKDNGVLLLISLEDRKIRIEVGRGLEGAIPDIVANNIIRTDIKPAFKQQNYLAGINSAVDHLQQAAVGEYKVPIKDNKWSKKKKDLFIIIFGFFAIILYYLINGTGRGGGGNGRRNSNWMLLPLLFNSGGSSNFSGGSGGGFSGFGGGSSGGGGASGDW
jgi:uncharacterized protein